MRASWKRYTQDSTHEGTCPITSGKCLRRLADKVLMHQPAAQKIHSGGDARTIWCGVVFRLREKTSRWRSTERCTERREVRTSGSCLQHRVGLTSAWASVLQSILGLLIYLGPILPPRRWNLRRTGLVRTVRSSHQVCSAAKVPFRAHPVHNLPNVLG